jgi:uncharacterized protein YdaU (DUF1376 family)
VAEFASLPLFTDSWVADTAHLTRAERGLYMDLIILCWRSPECRVPNEIDWIARKLKCTDDEIKSLERLISEFMRSTGNYLYQKRLLKEFRYTRASRKKKSDAAKARWNKEKDKYKRNASVHEASNAPTPTPTPTPTNKDTSLRSVNGVGKGTNRKHRLPDGWMPEPTDNDVGYALGFIEKEIEQEHAKFTDWAIGSNALKSNWNATFRNWLRTAAERKEANRVKVQGHQGRHH